MNKIRVLVVDDSVFFRKFLIDGLSKYDNIEIAGYAVNAIDARTKIRMLKPDVMTLDIEMPGMSGLELLKELLPVHPIPVILVSALNLRLFDALAAGAIDFVKKPDSVSESHYASFTDSLHFKLTGAKNAKVRLPGAGTLTALPLLPGKGPLFNKPTVIAIGASTGGTEAILAVLKALPDQLPPIVITQHMPPGFTDMYSKRLNRLTSMEVREAKNGDALRSGLALVAPGGMQMKLQKGPAGYCVTCSQGQRVNGLAPSVDVLFHSVAECAGGDGIGIILTGMGRDGADGLLHMRQKGAFTIGQDRQSCVVYGMPMEAWEAGAVCRQASLDAIPSLLMNYLVLQS